MDRGTWQAMAHGITKSRTRLSNLTHFHILHCHPGKCLREMKATLSFGKREGRIPSCIQQIAKTEQRRPAKMP